MEYGCLLPTTAVAVLDRLRQFAISLKTCQVDPTHKMTVNRNPDLPSSYASRGAIISGVTVGVPAEWAVGFTVAPGAGCESAAFALAKYPKTILAGDYPVRCRTGIGDRLRFEDSCKTEYAVLHGGIEHFLKCHLTIYQILKRAQMLGIKCDARDESGFWENKDLEALSKRVDTRGLKDLKFGWWDRLHPVLTGLTWPAWCVEISKDKVRFPRGKRAIILP